MSAPECSKCGRAHPLDRSCQQSKRLTMLAQMGDAFETMEKRIAELEATVKSFEKLIEQREREIGRLEEIEVDAKIRLDDRKEQIVGLRRLLRESADVNEGLRKQLNINRAALANLEVK